MRSVSYVEFARHCLIAVGVLTAIVLLLLLIITQVQFILLVFGGILLAIALRGSSEQIARRTPLSPRTALVLLLGLLAGLLVLGITRYLPQVIEQFQTLMAKLPEWVERARQSLDFLPSLNKIAPSPGNLLQKGLGFFSTTLGLFVDVLVIMVVGLYLAFDPHPYLKGMIRLFPMRQRDHISDVFREIGEILLRWLIGRAGAMLMVGVLTGIGLWLIGLNYAFVLALLAGLLTFIPFIGPIVAFIPAAFVSAPDGMAQLLLVTGLYVGVQVIERYVFTPLVEQQASRLPPAVVILAQLLFGLLIGGLGVMFATPLAAAVTVLVRRLYIEDILEQPDRSTDSRPLAAAMQSTGIARVGQ